MAGRAEDEGVPRGCSSAEGGSAGPEGAGGSLEEAADGSEERACRVCYNLFDLDGHAPSLLRCLHCFCLRCLSQLQEPLSPAGGPVTGVSITCPLCRQRTVLPDGRLLSLAPQGEAASPLPPLYQLRPLLPLQQLQQQHQQQQQQRRVRFSLAEQSSDWTTFADARPERRPAGTWCLRGCCHRWKPPDLFRSKRWLLAYFFFVIVLSAAGAFGLYRLNFGPGYILLTASIFFLSVAWCFKGATEMTAQEALLNSPEAAATAASCHSQASEDRTSCTQASPGWHC